MEGRNLYKLNRIPSLAEALAKRSQNIIAERQEKRREFFWGSRVELEKLPPPDKGLDQRKLSRAEMLKKWKAEKMKKIEEEKKKQKPIFKVGIVQRKATGSPVLTHQKVYIKKTQVIQPTEKKYQKNNTEVEKPGVLTRAKAKNMGLKAEMKLVCKPQSNFCKIEAGKKKKIESHVFKVPETVSKISCKGLTYPHSPKLLKRNEKSMKQQEEKVQEENNKVNATNESKSKEVNIQPQPKEKVVEVMQQEHKAEDDELKEIDIQPKMVSPDRKGVETDDYRPIVYSPFVTVRSGKKSKRRSRKTLSMNVEEQIKEEEDQFKCRIFSFRKYLEDEKKRLTDMCDKWKHIYEDFQEIPTDVEGDIDSVIGKTNLLTSDKFIQFKGLIDKCENGDPFVKIDDLQGFQDWVSIEVERIDEEFHKLEGRKRNNWKSETTPVKVVKVQKVNVSKKLSKKPVGNSNIRSHILAARKMLKNKNTEVDDESQLPVIHFEQEVKTPTPVVQKENLLKEVLNSETKKKKESSSKKSAILKERRNSGLEIMMATQKNKFPTPIKLQKSPLLTDYVVIVNKEETPCRSILKKTPKTENSSKGHVTFKKNRGHSSSRGRGLSEKYFQPLTDDESSPMRTVLGDLGNLTPMKMKTRSWTRQMSHFGPLSPQVN